MEPQVQMIPVRSEKTFTAPTIKTLTSAGSGGGGFSTGNRKAASGNVPKGSGGGGSGGNGGGGGSGNSEAWENPYDKLYNLTKKINAELRYREKLERSYQKLLKSTLTSGEEIDDNLQKQLASLKQRGIYEQEKISARRK